MINGKESKWFRSHCGIRQGDPISPYLFILVQQNLSNLFKEEVESKVFSPINLHGIKISHLIFANDLLVAFRGNNRSYQTLQGILDKDEGLTNLAVNRLTSEIFFHLRSSGQERIRICQTLESAGGAMTN